MHLKRDFCNDKIPTEATQALEAIENLLGDAVVGIYLHGSAVNGGLRVDSDVDILVVTRGNLSEETRRELTDSLLFISGKVGNPESIRPLEVTVVNLEDVLPWRFPPKREFIYGEWLRDKLEKGQIPAPTYDPDLAIILAQAREKGVSLLGPEASDVLQPVPMTDIRKGIIESLPGLLDNLIGDERNVILTLARMWYTAVVGEIAPKDVAAEWAIPQLPEEHAALLDAARKAYRGECADDWEGLETRVKALANYMKELLDSSLRL